MSILHHDFYCTLHNSIKFLRIYFDRSGFFRFTFPVSQIKPCFEYSRILSLLLLFFLQNILAHWKNCNINQQNTFEYISKEGKNRKKSNREMKKHTHTSIYPIYNRWFLFYFDEVFLLLSDLFYDPPERHNSNVQFFGHFCLLDEHNAAGFLFSHLFLLFCLQKFYSKKF